MRLKVATKLAVAGAVTVSTTVVGALTSAVQAAAPPGTPYTVGGNSAGQLGDGTTSPRLLAGPVSGLTDVIDLHGGREHVAALRSDGTVWTWGSNQQGQLGLGGGGNRSTPTQVPGLAGIVAVETGHNFTLALRGDGTVWTWGLNADGQLGDQTTTLRRSPVQVSGLTDAVAIAAGRNMSYAIRSDATLWAWGRNDEGQLGTGQTSGDRTSPVQVTVPGNVDQVAAGRDHGLAIRTDGTLWAWGSNNFGQVGDGSRVDRPTPRQVAAGIAETIAGAHHSYARRTDGQVISWGRNYRANLGDGTGALRTTPVLVVGVDDAISIGAGRDHGVAVMSDGTAMAWGHNDVGQLGDQTTVDRSVAVPVAGISGAVKAGGGGRLYSVISVGTGPPPNAPPVARLSVDCTGQSCDFDGSQSSDLDGTVQSWSWDFGDGNTGQGETTTHEYAEDGTYLVSLTVTDDEQAQDTATESVLVGDPPPVTLDHRAASTSSANTAQPDVDVPTSVQAGDRLVLFVTTNRTTTASTPAGWTQEAVATDGSMRSWVFTRAAAAGTAGSTVGLTLGARSKTSMVLLAYSDAEAPSAVASATEPGSSTSHDAPASTADVAGSAVLRYWADKTSTAHGWTLPGGVTERAATTGPGGGRITAVAGDALGVPAGPVPAVTAVAGAAASKAIAWTVVIPPA